MLSLFLVSKREAVFLFPSYKRCPFDRTQRQREDGESSHRPPGHTEPGWLSHLWLHHYGHEKSGSLPPNNTGYWTQTQTPASDLLKNSEVSASHQWLNEQINQCTELEARKKGLSPGSLQRFSLLLTYLVIPQGPAQVPSCLWTLLLIIQVLGNFFPLDV